MAIYGSLPYPTGYQSPSQMNLTPYGMAGPSLTPANNIIQALSGNPTAGLTSPIGVNPSGFTMSNISPSGAAASAGADLITNALTGQLFNKPLTTLRNTAIKTAGTAIGTAVGGPAGAVVGNAISSVIPNVFGK